MHGEHGNGSATEATGIREIVDTDLFGSQENRKSSTATTDADNQKLVDFGMLFLRLILLYFYRIIYCIKDLWTK
jgi:DNA excision repair protein ERCC-6-like 2